MYVTMIGIAGSGKTSYMAGLYEQLGIGSYKGFSIEPTPQGSDWLFDFLDYGKFSAISFAENGNNYPPSTQKTTVWTFNLLHQLNIIDQFRWIDYRGGLLTEKAETIANNDAMMEQLREVTSHIMNADAVLIFADAVVLTYYEEDIQQARIRAGIDRITNLMMSLARNHPNRPITYVILLTRADAVAEKWKQNNYAKLVQRGTDAFDKLIANARSKYNWTGGIVAVSAVGEGRAENIIKAPGNFQESVGMVSKLTRQPVPCNVTEALFYAIGQNLRLAAEMNQMQIAERRRQRAEILKRSNFGNRIWRFLTRQPSVESVVAVLDEQEQVFHSRLHNIEPHVRPLLDAAKEAVTPILPYPF